MEAKEKDNLRIQHLKDEKLHRDEIRWDKMNKEFEYYQQTEENMRQSKKALANKNSMPYDPITLRYSTTKEGKTLQLQDERTIYRAKIRQKMLFEKQTCGYDPITCEPKEFNDDIERPPTPDELRQ